MMRTAWCFLIVMACATVLVAEPTDALSARASLLAADEEFAADTLENGLDGFLAHFAEGASIYPPNSPPIVGKRGIRDYYAKVFAKPGFRLTWSPSGAGVADSVDLGYTVGEFEVAARDEDGSQIRRTGKYCMVWKKQGDGSWKVILDIGNGGETKVTEPQVEIV